MTGNPADIMQQSGQISAFLLAKQPAAGTFTTPTDYINTTSFDGEAKIETITFDVLNGQMDSMDQTATGLEDLNWKLSMPFYLRQGMPVIKAAIGSDTAVSGTPATWGDLGASAAIGDTQITLATAPPAPPTGVADWNGAVIQIGTGATADYSPVLGVSGAVVTTLALKNAHTTSDAVTVTSGHAFQPPLPGVNAGNIDYLSIVLQYAQISEWQLMDGRATDFSIKGDGKKFNVDIGMVFDSPVVAVNEPPTLNFSTVSNATNLASDPPLIMRHGGMISKFLPTDTVPVMHRFMTQLGYDLKYNVINTETNNPDMGVVLHTLGGRTGKVTWTELAKQYAGKSAMFTYAQTKQEQPIWLYFRHPTTGYSLCAYFSRATVDTFKPDGPKKDPVSYTGAIDVLAGHSGNPTMRLWVNNGLAPSY